LAVAAALVFGIAGVLGVARLRWDAGTRALRARLAAGATGPALAPFTERDLEGVPAPVARYFAASLRPGQPLVRHARLTWRGEFNLGEPGQDKWVPFEAEQWFVPPSPGFVWDARMRMAPGLDVFVRDAFVDGRGSMLGRAVGLWTVVDAQGSPEIATAALQRYLGEAVWFPTALLPRQGVRWEPLDDRRARATLTAGRVTATLEFRFGEDGLVASVFTPARSFDDGKSPARPEAWQARNLRHEVRAGLTVPADAVVEWLLPSGPHAYWRGRPLELELDAP
jgi:hypothetical protein